MQLGSTTGLRRSALFAGPLPLQPRAEQPTVIARHFCGGGCIRELHQGPVWGVVSACGSDWLSLPTSASLCSLLAGGCMSPRPRKRPHLWNYDDAASLLTRRVALAALMQPPYSATLESSSAKRSRQHTELDTAVEQPFGLGGYGVVALPARGATHILHGLHSHDSSIALQGQRYLGVPVRAQNGSSSKRPYSELEPVLAFDAERSAQRLAYQALLERLPVNPTQRSIMCAFLRDELREILRMNRLSYHKSGAENKVSVQSNATKKPRCLLVDDSSTCMVCSPLV